MLTQEQKLARTKTLGGSEIAAVMNCDPHCSAADVWLTKTGQAEPFEGNEATERGIRLEPLLIDWCEGQIGKESRRDVMVAHPNGLMHTNFDALASDEESIEAKTTVLTEGWGDAGTDQVPEKVILQVHHGFVCMPTLRQCYVPVLMPEYRALDFRLYIVKRDDILVELVEKAACEFMESYVRPGIRPTDFRPSVDVLRRIRRVPEKVVPINAAMLDRWIVLDAAAKEATRAAEDAKHSLIAELADGEAGEVDGRLAVTYMEIHRRGYEVQPSSYRQLRLIKGKDL